MQNFRNIVKISQNRRPSSRKINLKSLVTSHRCYCSIGFVTCYEDKAGLFICRSFQIFIFEINLYQKISLFKCRECVYQFLNKNAPKMRNFVSKKQYIHISAHTHHEDRSYFL